ncbi:hypothetical protein LTR85_012255 [Meristemomyces frigidus]|nr:hypothetical protein LTR85_012255 [Meristemomyces frigidus]
MHTPRSAARADAESLAEANSGPPVHVETRPNDASERTDHTPTPLVESGHVTGSMPSKERRSLGDQRTSSEDRSEQYFGSLVSRIHGLRRQRQAIEQEVRVKRNSIGQVDNLERHLTEIAKRAEELERQAQQAREQADTARGVLARARTEEDQKEKDIALATQMLEQLAREEKAARESLQID